MTVDPKIIEAIKEAAQEEGQSDALACLLIAWFDAIASGNEEINDRQSANRHLELLYGEGQLSEKATVTQSAVSSDESLSPEE